MEDFVREMREMEETADEIYERDSVRFHLQPAPLSRALEKSRAELSRLSAEDEGGEDSTASLVEDLRVKVCRMDEQCDKVEREKAVLADLLNSKKKDFDQMKMHYKKRISELEDEGSRLKSEKSRLVDKLKLPESERTSLAQQENDLAALKRRLDDAEARCSDMIEENAELKQEVKDVQLEMEEMHDQFREEETMEFRELQKELETTAKSCRILQFKLRKTERRNEQLETERIQAEEKLRQMESRLLTSDDKQHIMELELELTAAKETTTKLRSELEGVEEKKARFEEELDRVNDLLTQSETRRKELESQMGKAGIKEINGKPSTSNLNVPAIGKLSKQGSQEIDVGQLMRDLSDSLERENDLKEQLRFSEEETRIVRKKLSELEEENESVNMQLHKISTAKTLLPSSIKKSPTRSTGKDEPEVVTEREHEFRLQMELAEQELKVLRRKLDEREKLYEDLLSEVKVMASRVQDKDYRGETASDSGRSEEERIQELAKDIEVLKWKLLEKDKDSEKAKASIAGRAAGIQKSRSLEESSSVEYQADYKKQLDTVQQEARILKDKIYNLEKENDILITENKKLQILSSRSSKSPQHPSLQKSSGGEATPGSEDLQGRIQQLEADNGCLSDSLARLEARAAELSKEVVRARFSAEAVVETSVEWRELRSQVQFLEDENRLWRRKTVDLEAGITKLQAELSSLKGDVKYKDSKAYKELQNETLDNLKRRIVELDNEMASLSAVIKNREEDNDRLQAEVTESRDDMKRMLDTIRRRELELQDELKSSQHKNDMLSDLLDLVTERAESTQKELERQRKEVVRAASTSGSELTVTPSPEAVSSSLGSPNFSAEQNQRENLKSIESLKKQLEEEKRKVQAAEKKLKMVDVPLSVIKDDSRLREHEKSILVQELALCQKQLKSADEQITDLKERMLNMRETHEDIKEDYAKVSKQLEKAREKGVSKVGDTNEAEKGATSSKPTPVKPERAPASWRWEKQELERQLKEYMKKLDDVHSEMKRSQIRWKAAGEDIERDNKIKEELERKISKLKEDCEQHKKKADEYEDKLDEVQDQLRKKEKQWEKEKQMLGADKAAAETDVKQKDEVIRTKDEIINEKNQLIGEKDSLLADRNDSLQQKEVQLQQKESEQEFKDRELRMKSEEISQYRNELFEFRAHLLEKEERIKQLDEHVRRRDDRLNEKDSILQQINRKLVEKGNQISDMDKTIRQVIRKLQARDCDLSMCNAELKRIQAELKLMTERLAEAKKALEESQNEARRQSSEWRSHAQTLEAELEELSKKNDGLEKDLKEVEETGKLSERQWKTENDKLQIELNNTQERLHVKEISETMNQTEAFKLLMKEKENLIVEKFRASDEVKQLQKQLSGATKQWEKEKEELEKSINQKIKELEERKATHDFLESEVNRLKDLLSSSSAHLSLAPLTIPLTGGSPDGSSSSGAPGSGSGVGADQAELLAALQSRLTQQETNWRAEKATLEEFYEVNARGLKERVEALREGCSALRRENDSQLQLLATSRRALSDLRNRYDIGLASWSEDKQRIEASNDLAAEFKERIVILEMTVERLKSESRASDSRRQEIENNLMVERNQWKADRSNLEDRLKKYTNVEEKSSNTRVSQFRAKFEAFGNTKSKKSLDGAVEKDFQDTCRELQQQLSDAETARQTEREEAAQRVEQLKIVWDKENKELRERNIVLERKAHELVQVQRSLVDVQCRLVEDRHQWQLERTELQHQIEEWRKGYLLQKESINKLLADVKKLKVLASGVDLKALGGSQEPSSAKQRQRSITSSAEKLRTAAGTITIHTGTSSGTAKQPTGGDTSGAAGNGSTSDKSNESPTSRDQTPAMFTLVQAIEATSRLADDISQSRIDQKTLNRSHGNTRPTSFKRSKSTVEVESDCRRAQSVLTSGAPSTISSMQYRQAVPTHGSAPYQSGNVTMRRPADFSRTSSEEEDPYSDLRSSLRKPSSNRGSIYASGTQSAHGSRDASPDKAPTITMRRVSPYPLAPPSMIITPSHTPKREASVERSGQESSFTSEDIRRIYDKLDAMERESEGDEISRGRTARGVPSGRSLGIKSTSVDVNTDASGAMQLATGYQQINIPSSSDVRGAGLTDVTDTTISQSRSRLTVEGPVVGGTAGKRSTSVSPRTARKQFYAEYDSRLGSHRAPVYRSDLPNVVTEGIAEGFVPTQTSTFSSSRSYDASSSTGSLSAAGDPSHTSGTEEKPSTKSKFSAASFFQTVKEKRKLFGTKKSRSVDSSATGLSIGKMGANVLTEPAAPSTYQPPVVSISDRSAKSGKMKHKRTSSMDSSAVHSTGISGSAEKSKDGT